MATAVRLTRPLPYSWELNVPEKGDCPYSQLSLATCNLSHVPALRDGHGHLSVLSGEEAYQIPDSLLLDEVDEEAATKLQKKEATVSRLSSFKLHAVAATKLKSLGKEQRAARKVVADATKAASSSDDSDSDDSDVSSDVSSDDDDSDDDDDDDDDDSDETEESDAPAAAQPPPAAAPPESDAPSPSPLGKFSAQPPPKTGVTACASLRLTSNHIASVDANAFENLPYLRALDLSLNHLESLSLSAEATKRLTTLALANNHIGPELGAITLLSSLQHLDVSLNSLTTLEGIGKLKRLRALNASGNKLAGSLPSEMRTLQRLLLCNLSHNQLSSGVQVLTALTGLSTLRLCHNDLPKTAMPHLASALGSLSLRRLTLYGNPLCTDPSYPASLQAVQPALGELDHMRLPGMLLSKGVAEGQAVSKKTIFEAVDSIANAAISQHAVLNERHRNAHDVLLETLKNQRAAAAAALAEYKAVTGKAEANFKQAVAEAKRPRGAGDVSDGGPMAVIDRMLSQRQQLLTSERVSLGRYRDALRESTVEVEAALAAVVEGEDSLLGNAAPQKR